MKIKAIFLDRDGIINVDTGYVFKISEIKLVSGTIEVLNLLKEKGYKFFIITNQSGVARGYYTEKDVNKINSYLLDILKKEGIIIEKIKFCPHHPEGKILKYAIHCECRKPKNALIKEILEEYNIDKENSYFLGDSQRDMVAGKNSNLKTILINEKIKFKDEFTDFIFKDMIEFKVFLSNNFIK